jgi:hypothetical protein
MPRRDWIDDEPGAAFVVRQVIDVFAAGVRRPALWVASQLLFIAVVVLVVTFSRQTYAPSYLIRVVEADRDVAAAPTTRRQLADYVRQAVFTSAPLLDVMRRHGLYPSLSKKNPHAALESFREDIEVEVFQNYFLEARNASSSPRSARLRVSYHHTDPNVAVNVTRELGRLIVEHESSLRQSQTSRAAARAKQEVDASRRALAARRSAIALTRDEIERSPRVEPHRQVEFVGLAGSLPALELRQDEAERRAASLGLEAALERQGVGMSFQVVDDATLPPDSSASSRQFALVVAALALGLPLVTLGVGAFGRRKGLT